MTDNLTPEQRKKNMTAIRSVNSLPELLVRSEVHKMGFRFRLHKKGLPSKPDIVLTRHRKVIFVHGCFWHRHNCRFGKVKPKTNKTYWSLKIQNNVERDKKNIRTLRKGGWKILIIWECQTKIENFLKTKLKEFLFH